MDNVNLATFAGGQLQQKFNMAFAQVLSNLQDLNTPYKNKRKISIDITFEQNELRDDVSVGVSVATKLASVAPTKTSLSVGKDLDTGEIYCQEYGSQVFGQMNFSTDNQQNINVEENDSNNKKNINVEENDSNNKKVLDLRKVN